MKVFLYHPFESVECNGGQTSAILAGLCKSWYLGGEDRFITILATIGMGLKMVEILQILQGKATLESEFWRNRIKHSGERCLSPQHEKKMKFVFALIYFGLNCMLLFSVICKNPVLMAPWLVLQSTTLTIEAFLFILRLFVGKSFPTIREMFLLFCLLIFWKEVYCYHQILLSTRNRTQSYW